MAQPVAAVLLDTSADAAAAAAVAAAGGNILVTRGWYHLHPAAALAIAVVVTYHAVGLIRKIMAAFGLLSPTPAAGPGPPRDR